MGIIYGAAYLEQNNISLLKLMGYTVAKADSGGWLITRGRKHKVFAKLRAAVDYGHTQTPWAQVAMEMAPVTDNGL